MMRKLLTACFVSVLVYSSSGYAAAPYIVSSAANVSTLNLVGQNQISVLGVIGSVTGAGGLYSFAPNESGMANGATILQDAFGHKFDLTGPISPVDGRLWGVDMTGAENSSAAFESAINSGIPITLPCGTVRVINTVVITAANASFVGSGNCTHFNYDAATNSPAAPLFDIRATAVNASISNFSFDMHADTKGFVDPVIYAANPIAGSGILAQPDAVSISNVTGANAYDNCIAAVQFSGTNAVPHYPRYYSVDHIRTNTCGWSSAHTGGGLDIACGSVGTVNDLVDTASYAGFIEDLGCGASGNFTNITANQTKYDGSIASYGIYIGSSDSNFSNVTITSPGYRGIWFANGAKNNQYSNISVKASGAEGIYINGGGQNINGLIVDSPGFGKTGGTVDAMLIDSTSASISGLIINNYQILNTFNSARYGINRTGSNSLTGIVTNYNSAGTVTASNNIPKTFGTVDYLWGSGWTSFSPNLSCDTGTLSTATSSGAYNQTGKTVSFSLTINIASHGTCAGRISATLPLVIANRSGFSGAATSAAAYSLDAFGFESTSAALISKYDGTTASLDGIILSVNGTYQAN